MKTTLIVLLSGLLFCGCSKKQATPASPAFDQKQATQSTQAIDLVKSDSNVGWSDGYNLTVTKRDGDSIEGLSVLQHLPNGEAVAMQAAKATVMPGSIENSNDESCVTIKLFNASVVTKHFIYKTNEVVLVLHKKM